MTAAEVILEIEALPPQGQAEVIRFTHKLDAKRQLSPEELGELAKRMVEETDPAEQARLEAAFIQGFYGEIPHA